MHVDGRTVEWLAVAVVAVLLWFRGVSALRTLLGWCARGVLAAAAVVAVHGLFGHAVGEVGVNPATVGVVAVLGMPGLAGLLLLRHLLLGG